MADVNNAELEMWIF